MADAPSKAAGEARPPYTDADGTVFEWDANKRAYFPKARYRGPGWRRTGLLIGHGVPSF